MGRKTPGCTACPRLRGGVGSRSRSGKRPRDGFDLGHRLKLMNDRLWLCARALHSVVEEISIAALIILVMAVVVLMFAHTAYGAYVVFRTVIETYMFAG